MLSSLIVNSHVIPHSTENNTKTKHRWKSNHRPKLCLIIQTEKDFIIYTMEKFITNPKVNKLQKVQNQTRTNLWRTPNKEMERKLVLRLSEDKFMTTLALGFQLSFIYLYLLKYFISSKLQSYGTTTHRYERKFSWVPLGYSTVIGGGKEHFLRFRVELDDMYASSPSTNRSSGTQKHKIASNKILRIFLLQPYCFAKGIYVS